MTIANFLNKCELNETKLRITARGKGRVYDGTIKEFKIGEEDLTLKSRLSDNEIYCISFAGIISTYNADGCGAHFEPVVTITI